MKKKKKKALSWTLITELSLAGWFLVPLAVPLAFFHPPVKQSQCPGFVFSNYLYENSSQLLAQWLHLNSNMKVTHASVQPPNSSPQESYCR